MRFARGDMRDHIVSYKNDHGASCWRYGILPQRSRLKITFCEIFDVTRFSTFATLSPQEQTSPAGPVRSEKCQFRTHAPQRIASSPRVTRTVRSLVHAVAAAVKHHVAVSQSGSAEEGEALPIGLAS